MGASQSEYATETEGSRHLQLPIPDAFYAPLAAFLMQRRKGKRKRIDPHVHAFHKFMNNTAQMMAVYNRNKEGTKYVDDVMAHFNAMGEFASFWSDLPPNGIYSRSVRHIMLRDGVVEEDAPDARTLYDTKFVQTTIYTCVGEGLHCFIPIFIMVLNGDGDAHANMGLLEYMPEKRRLTFKLFEPHATTQAVQSRRLGLYTFLYTPVAHASVEQELPSVKVTAPTSDHTGLQGDAPLCLQWSLIMLLTYMINCRLEGHAGCSSKVLNRTVAHMFSVRKRLMPIWMYYMNTEIVRSDAVREGEEVLDGFGADSEIDPYGCAESPLPCRYPCSQGRDGKCFNKKLFRDVSALTP